jgi:aminopeptidase N
MDRARKKMHAAQPLHLLLLLLLGPALGGLRNPVSPSPSLEVSRYWPAPVALSAEDFSLELTRGAAFAVRRPDTDSPDALLLVGRGRLHFAPPVLSEERQLSLDFKSPFLDAPFDAAYARLPPGEFERTTSRSGPVAGAAPASLERDAERALHRALEDPLARAVFSPADLFVSIDARRLGRLAYVDLPEEPEDLMLRTETGTVVCLYPSLNHREQFGLDYGDEYGLPYEVDHYDVDFSVETLSGKIEGRARLQIRSRQPLATMVLRLDPGLAVSSVRSESKERLEFSKSPGSDRLFLKLDPPIPAGNEVPLEIDYEGSVAPQDLASEVAPADRRSAAAKTSAPMLLLSNQVWWYPQSPVRNHTTATIRVRVPAGCTALASGVLEPGGDKDGTGSDRRTFMFEAVEPVRYLSLLVARLQRVTTIENQSAPDIQLFAAADLVDRARAIAPEVARIVRFFASEVGDVPYPELSVALVDSPVPAGHSPAGLAILGEPPAPLAHLGAETPSFFPGDPSFWIAHEIAHQWWGQAVGWRNYRQQWLSEAFAQYFAALYIQHSRGERPFVRVLAWMASWARKAAGRGPIDLGIRVGSITGEPWLFPAVVYDRGALVLHMLRGWLGDEAFFAGLRAYYRQWKFRRAGTADLQSALEKSSGTHLGLFFDRWVRDDQLPDLHWSESIVGEPAHPKLRIDVDQTGETFPLPLEVAMFGRGSPERVETVRLDRTHQEFLFAADRPIGRIEINPDLAALCDVHRR